jgi:hypothetical protein
MGPIGKTEGQGLTLAFGISWTDGPGPLTLAAGEVPEGEHMTELVRGMLLEPNEGDWLTGQMPSVMMYYLAKLATDRRIEFHLSVKATERKLRLFYCGCARRVWHLLEGAVSRHAVEVCERFSDAQVEKKELRAALQGAEETLNQAKSLGLIRQNWELYQAMDLPILAAKVTVNNARQGMVQEGGPVKQQEQVVLLKELFANPFRPSQVDSAWLTPTVVQLARGAYEDRQLPAGTFDSARLAILADALEEVGCTDADILRHLRGPDLHVRGCWAIDLLLGKQ